MSAEPCQVEKEDEYTDSQPNALIVEKLASFQLIDMRILEVETSIHSVPPALIT
jgi:hypothetical protein